MTQEQKNDIESRKELYFLRGDYNKEWIVIEGKAFPLKSGEIIRCVHAVEQSWLSDVRRLTSQNQTEMDNLYLQLKTSGTHNLGHDITQDWRQLFDETSEHFRQILALDGADDIIKQLLLFIPCYEQYTRHYNAAQRMDRTSEEKELDSAFLRGGYKKYSASDRAIINEDISARLRRSQHEEQQAYYWWRWIDYLNRNDYYTLWPSDEIALTERTVPYFCGMLQVTHEYCEELQNTISELEKKRELLTFIISSPGISFDAMTHLGPTKSEYTGQEQAYILHRIGLEKAKTLQVVSSFSDLIAYELGPLLKKGKEPILCPLCHKLFIPPQRESTYCQYPNDMLNGNTCARHAALEDYERRLSAVKKEKQLVA